MRGATVALVLFLTGCPYLAEADLSARLDVDGDGFARPDDCDDGDPAVGGPGAWHVDTDGDGFGGSTATETCAWSEGLVADASDCDDTDPAVHPAADEACNEVDDDCDGTVDETIAVPTWYRDLDRDGYGDLADSQTSCFARADDIQEGGDCDDTDAAVHPGVEEACNEVDDDCDGDVDEALVIPKWYPDTDRDGYGDPDGLVEACAAPGGSIAEGGDCDDGDPAIHPGAEEVCDEVDDDCDGDVDEDLLLPVWYRDADEDGHGDPEHPIEGCFEPSGFVTDCDDCDDLDPGVSPDEREVCDPFDVDEDCDGAADDMDLDALGRQTVYEDLDGDGFGVDSTTATACDPGSGWALDAGDCDDADTSRNPDTLWYRDRDEDGYGDAAYPVRSCLAVDGYALDGRDCDDTEPTYNPAGQEACDLYDVDEDCDGVAEDADPTVAGQLTIYEDLDGDGYGVDATETLACDVWSGWVLLRGDCAAGDPSMSPGEPEVCDDGMDQDCNASIDCDDVGCSLSELCGYFSLGAADLDLLGYEYYEHAGYDVAWVGDVTSDGMIDFAVSSTSVGTSDGLVYLVDGAARGAGALRSTAFATISGSAHPYQRFGSSIAAMGDLDGDGFDDLAVGAYGDSTYASSSGAVFLFLGPVSGSLAEVAADGLAYGSTVNAYYGSSCIVGGVDVTGDGIADVVVSNGGGAGIPVLSGADLPGTSTIESTAVAVIGHINELGLDTCDLDGDGIGDLVAAGYTVDIYTGPLMTGDAASTTFTGLGSMTLYSEASCRGDLDGDGSPDLALTKNSESDSTGSVWIFNGPFAPSVSLSSATATITDTALGRRSAADLEITGDLDGDGLGDLVIGAPGADDGGTDAGAGYFLFGPVAGTFALADMDGVLGGEAPGDYAGFSVDAGDDADGDGRRDLLITSTDQDGAGPGRDYGAAYLLLGSRF